MTLVICVLLLPLYIVVSLCNRINSGHIVNKILSADLSTIPSEVTGKPVDIVLEVFFTQMRSLVTEEVDFTFYLYQSWMDPRLVWGNETERYRVINRNRWHNLWMPDTYVENELKSFIHEISPENKFIWSMPNGTVVYGIRLASTISCKLGSMKFPVAYYTCSLKFRVHSYETTDVRLQWFYKSVDFAKDFAGASIQLVSWEKHNCTHDRSSVTIHSCLELKMRLEKNYGVTVLRTYLPSIFIVVVGWLSFWVDRNEVSARVKLCTLVLLAMINEEIAIYFHMPSRVSNSAVDVWFAVILAFSAMVIVEFVIVHSIDRFQMKLKLELEQKEKTEVNRKGIVFIDSSVSNDMATASQ